MLLRFANFKTGCEKFVDIVQEANEKQIELRSITHKLKEASDSVFDGSLIEACVNEAFSNAKLGSGLNLSPFLHFQSLGIDFMKKQGQGSEWIRGE